MPGKSIEGDPGCDLWTDIFNAAILVNPAFNEYRIFDMVSIDTSAPFALTDSLVVSRFVGRSGIPVSFFGFLRVHQPIGLSPAGPPLTCNPRFISTAKM